MPTSLYSHKGEDKDRIHLRIIRGDTDTSPTEKQYLKAVEKGDFASVQSFLEESAIYFNININCVDALGRTALIMAIENENMEIIELLLSYNVDLGDALLFAIEEEVPQAVEILLTYRVPKASKKDQMALMNGAKKQESNFTPDITPVILAAHTNNYEILKTLVARGATIVKPHGVKCSCYECVHSATFDSLRHSQTRINAYKALASPCLMILASDDPFLTAFELSRELYNLSFGEVEFKEEYQKLSYQCSKFAVDLLDQTRGSQELKTILNRTTDPLEILGLGDSEDTEVEHMNLSRFKLAIEYRQKEFVAHPNCQQLLSHIWYQGIPGWKQGNMIYKLGFTLLISLTFPFTALLYICFPFSSSVSVLKNPFVKFINHSASYVSFLILLVLASAEVFDDNVESTHHRNRSPNIPEWIIVVYVLAFIWSEMKEIYESGFLVYSSDLWNIMDFMQNTLYLATIALRITVYFGPDYKISRAEMNSNDPMLVAEGLFAVANISSTLRLLFLFTANSHLGPLQISLGRMIVDIGKFLFIYALVLISFASGMKQLLYLEYDKDDLVNNCSGVTCKVETAEFASTVNSIVTLFWTVMGLVNLSAVSVNEEHAFTKQMAMVLYLTYHVIAIVILLNMLIAMMNLSYEQIVRKSDNEWKFSRSRLWMSYFENGKTVPPPFNIIVSPKTMVGLLRKVRTLCVADLQELQQRQNLNKVASKLRDLERKYQDVMTNLTQRYIANLKRSQDFEPVTEDDLNEIKQDISSFRYEVIELLRRQNGDDNGSTGNRTGNRSSNRTGSLHQIRQTSAGRSTLRKLPKQMLSTTTIASVPSSPQGLPDGSKNKESQESMVSQVAITDDDAEEGLRGSDEHHESTWALAREPTEGGDAVEALLDDARVATPPIYDSTWMGLANLNRTGFSLISAQVESREIFNSPFILVQDDKTPYSFRVQRIAVDQMFPNLVNLGDPNKNPVVEPAEEQLAYERTSPGKRRDCARRKSVVIQSVEDERRTEEVEQPSHSVDHASCDNDVISNDNDGVTCGQSNDVTANDVTTEWVAENSESNLFGPETPKNTSAADEPDSQSLSCETLETIAVHNGEEFTDVQHSSVQEVPEQQTPQSSEVNFTESHGMKFLAPRKNKFARMELGNPHVSPARERSSYLWNQKDSNSHM